MTMPMRIVSKQNLYESPGAAVCIKAKKRKRKGNAGIEAAIIKG